MEENNNDGPISPMLQQALLAGLPVLAGALFGGNEGGALGAKVGLGALNQVQEEEAAVQKQKFELEKFKQKEIFSQQAKLDRLSQELDIRSKAPLSEKDKIELTLKKGNLDARKSEVDMMLEEQKRKEAEALRRENQFKYNISKDEDKQLTDFEKRHKEKFDRLDTLDTFINVLNDPKAPISSGMVNNFIARNINQEVGSLSDSDKKSAGLPAPLLDKLINYPSEFFSGELTPEMRKGAINLLSIAQKKQEEKAIELIKNRGKRFDKLYGKEEGTFEKVLTSEKGLDKSKDNTQNLKKELEYLRGLKNAKQSTGSGNW